MRLPARSVKNRQGNSIESSQKADCEALCVALGRTRYVERGPDRRDAEPMRGPSNVEPDAVTLIEKLDTRHLATDRRTYDVNEWKPKGNLFAAEGTHETTAAHTVEHHDHPFIKIVRETLAVENVAQFASSLIVIKSRSAKSLLPQSGLAAFSPAVPAIRPGVPDVRGRSIRQSLQ
jgi:hypothetical protein